MSFGVIGRERSYDSSKYKPKVLKKMSLLIFFYLTGLYFFASYDVKHTCVQILNRRHTLCDV